MTPDSTGTIATAQAQEKTLKCSPLKDLILCMGRWGCLPQPCEAIFIGRPHALILRLALSERMSNLFFVADPELTLRITFISLVTLSIFIAKVLSIRDSGLRSEERLSFWLTPLLSVISWQKSIPARNVKWENFLIKGIVSILAIWAGTWIFLKFAHAFDLHGWVISYVVALLALVYQMAATTLIQIWSLISGRLLHSNGGTRVLRTKTLPEFWQQWSPWVHDIFKQLIFRPLAHRPILASFAVFAFSGLWHELLINVPLLLIFGVNLVGGWTAYFLIQWLAIIVDQRLLKSTILWRRALLYVAVILPLPLILNEGLLRIFGWWRL